MYNFLLMSAYSLFIASNLMLIIKTELSMPIDLHTWIFPLHLLGVIMVLGVLQYMRRYFNTAEGTKTGNSWHFSVVLVALVLFEAIVFQGYLSYDSNKGLHGSELGKFRYVINYQFQGKRNLVFSDDIYKYHETIQNYNHMTSMAKEDLCLFVGKKTFMNRYIDNLLVALGWQTEYYAKDDKPTSDIVTFQAIGCSYGKLRLERPDFVARDEQGAIDYLKKNRYKPNLLVIEEPRETGKDVRPAPIMSSRQGIQVREFSMNRLDLVVSNPDGEDTWLYYADAWHPNWRAYINGTSVPVARANIAFKAVKVPKGTNGVTFRFENPKVLKCFYFIIGVCVVMSLVIISLSVRVLIGEMKDAETN